MSGFCSLLYQIVWIRLAFAAFGIITPVLSVVVSVFMLGLAVGSWTGGRYIQQLNRNDRLPLIIYALMESVIGIGGLLVPVLFSVGQTMLLPSGDFNSFNYLLLSALILGVSILPWCICMGATIPLMMAFIKQLNKSGSRGFSYLYLANVIGAMLGTFVTTVFLIELVGLHRTLLIAACFNFCLAIIALILNFVYQNKKLHDAIETIPINADFISKPTSSKRSFLLLILFTTGFVSMAMEITWTRAFMPILGTTVYAFAAILIVYLFATWIGSGLYRLHSRNQEILTVPYIMVSLAVVSFLPIVFNDPRMFHLFRFLKIPFVMGSMRIVILGSIFPFCVILGYLTPKLIDELSIGNPEIAGRAYAINTIGCILGPLFAGYVLLPFAGVRFSLVLMVIPFLGYFVYYIKLLWHQNNRYVLSMGFLCIILLIGSTGFFLSYEDSVFYYSAEIRRDYVATVISAGKGMEKKLLTNGIGMASLTPITKCMAHIPLAIREKKPESILVICLGMGTTFRSAASWDIKTIAVELVPGVRDAIGFYFQDAADILRKPNNKIVVDDGRRFLRRTTEKFDVVTIDPPPPVYGSGSGFLYSKEFYEILKSRLKEDGILQQWAPGGDSITITGAAKALQLVFPYVRTFHSIEGWGWHFFASMQPFEMPSVEQFVSRIPIRASVDFVEWNSGESAGMLYQKLLNNEIKLEQILTSDVPYWISDDRPLNEYFLIRKLFKRQV